MFRGVHAAIAVAFLSAIAYVWWCALTGHRGSLLRVVVAALAGEGMLVAAGRGDCPLAPLQERLGDPVPLFELILSPSAARRAIPVLGAVAAAGMSGSAQQRSGPLSCVGGMCDSVAAANSQPHTMSTAGPKSEKAAGQHQQLALRLGDGPEVLHAPRKAADAVLVDPDALRHAAHAEDA